MSEVNTSSTTGGPFVNLGPEHTVTVRAPRPLSNEQMFRQEAFELWEAQTRFLLGKVLTVVDASYSDREQRKAVKDLVKQQFYEQTKHVCGILTGQKMLSAAGEETPPA